MIDIPVKAKVQCSDGHVGRATYVIVNPINQLLTHLVVKDDRPPFGEHVVPVDRVEDTAPDLIKLSCTRDEFRKMGLFIYHEYIRVKSPDYEKWKDSCLAWPYVQQASDAVLGEQNRYTLMEHKNVPLGELAVRRGARVEATDGYIGKVEELLVNSKNTHVTHLVVREKRLWRKREMTIPVSQIDRVEENSVHLKLDRQSIAEMPTVPVQRWSL